MRSRMSAIGSLTLVLVASAGCGEGTTEPDARLWQLDFFAAEVNQVTNVGRDCRLVTVLENEASPIQTPWQATLSMEVQRTASEGLNTVQAREEQTFTFRLEAIGPDGVRLIVGGAWADTLDGLRAGQFGFRGPWACDETFPLADAQAILDAGYPIDPPIQGIWTLGPLPPPG